MAKDGIDLAKVLTNRVCKRWKKLTHTSSLWRKVDLHPYSLKLRHLWKLLRTYFTSSLVQLNLRGFVKKFQNKPSYATPVISTAFLQSLSHRCPNLKCFTLNECYIYNNEVGVKLSDFPKSIETLAFTSSTFSNTHDWFVDKSYSKKILPNLRSLDVSETNFPPYAFNQIPRLFPHLETLILQRCLRVTNDTLHRMFDSLEYILVLNIKKVRADNETMLIISQHCRRLKELYISSPQVTDDGLEYMKKDKLPDLRILDLSGCSITNSGIQVLVANKLQINELVLKSTEVTNEGLEFIKDSYMSSKVQVTI
ncbi:F-box/LRR-repeat protein 12 [Nymphon striatum]|nr:F-box/LRR-repeat protein 12 [Nymphon striatum]